MPLLLIGALGLVALIALSRKAAPAGQQGASPEVGVYTPAIPPPGMTYDPGMSHAQTETVKNLLTSETDPVALVQAAQSLSEAGFDQAADLAAKKAALAAPPVAIMQVAQRYMAKAPAPIQALTGPTYNVMRGGYFYDSPTPFGLTSRGVIAGDRVRARDASVTRGPALGKTYTDTSESWIYARRVLTTPNDPPAEGWIPLSTLKLFT
jgi:hypothetical protein